MRRDPATKKEWLASLRDITTGRASITVSPHWLLAILFGIALAFVVKIAGADPLVQAVVNSGRVVITVYSESCALTEFVANLPKRATWKEGDKVFEGCAGVSPLGVAMFYFREDKSIAVVPIEMFERVTGA